MKEGICTLTGILGAGLCWAFGGWDAAMAALLVCMSVDYVSGSLVALVFHKSSKTESGAYNSMYGLKGLCKKCELIIVRATPGEIGQPTSEALEFLQKSVITPAQAEVEKGNVSEETYNIYVALYHQFLMMPRASVADAIDTSKYYYIRNAYFTTNYAALNSSNSQVDSKAKGTTNNFLWSFVKNNDGTVYI